MRLVSLRLPESMIEYCAIEGDGNLSEGIRRIVTAHEAAQIEEMRKHPNLFKMKDAKSQAG